MQCCHTKGGLSPPVLLFPYITRVPLLHLLHISSHARANASPSIESKQRSQPGSGGGISVKDEENLQPSATSATSVQFCFHEGGVTVEGAKRRHLLRLPRVHFICFLEGGITTKDAYDLPPTAGASCPFLSVDVRPCASLIVVSPSKQQGWYVLVAPAAGGSC